MFFKDVIGHDELKAHLIKSVQSGKIAHAQLFAGTEGVGKFRLAMAYAQYIQCTNRGETDSCGQCPSCIQHSKFMHPDFHFAFPVIKVSQTTICADYLTQWRAFLASKYYFSLRDWMQYLGGENKQPGIFVKESDEIIRKLSIKSYESDYKIMLIWLPEKMNEQCSNKILKILEEPYEKTIFLLVSNNPEQLLSTIISRTQRINIPPVQENIISDTLVNRFGVIAQQAIQIAHISNGNPLRALENIDVVEENQHFFELFVRLMRSAYARKLKDMKLWSEEMAAMTREMQKNFLSYAQRMVRENFILNLHNPQLNYMTDLENSFSSRFAPFVNHNNIEGIMEELQLAEIHVTQNVNSKIVFFDLSLKFIMLLKNS